MATVYKIEVVSDWINYSEEELKKLIKESLVSEKQNLRIVKVEKKLCS